MAKLDDDHTYTTWDGRTITDAKALLRDPKVQETMRKLSNNQDLGSRKGYITVVRHRKPE